MTCTTSSCVHFLGLGFLQRPVQAYMYSDGSAGKGLVCAHPHPI